MRVPLNVTLRNVEVPLDVESLCERELEKLEHHGDWITSCRVTVSRPHNHHRKGALFEVHVDLAVPGGEIVVDRTPSDHETAADVQAAVRDAFGKARRRLDDWIAKHRS